MDDALKVKEEKFRRWGSLKAERSSWVEHAREISEVLLPRAGRFLLDDRNRGEKRHRKILDDTATRALRILAAGLQAGMTSPARPWFMLTTSVPELDESPQVKRWLSDVTRLLLMIFQRSNIYRTLHTDYEELGAFGTASTVITDNFDTVIHGHALTFGEYAIATDALGRVNTLYREFQMTVGQMVGWFGKEAVSQTARTLYDRGSLDQWVTVLHCIEPRADRDVRSPAANQMRYESVYLEAGANEGKFLRNSGFREFRALCPRWAVTGGDIYGSSPAMDALGGIKQLQVEQLRKSQGIDYMSNPPKQIPTSLKGQEAGLLPGGVTYYDPTSQYAGVRSAFDVRLDLSHLLADIQDVRERINGAFYADLFLMLANSTNPQMTATEVAERHEEKLLMLGPVIERIGNEVLDSLIDIGFTSALEAGMVPPPPPELEGMELRVEYISTLAQAQKAVGLNSVDRYLGVMATASQLKPEIIDRIDADYLAEHYADLLGVDPKLVVPGKTAALIRQQRADADAQQQQAAQMSMAADAASKLGRVDTSKPNALDDVAGAMAGM